ncbi:MAG: hypothetical protein QM530_02340 [Phycisphaerales bacterium]|nr:hypothetical protein [Phycisphaerales bacterium]
MKTKIVKLLRLVLNTCNSFFKFVFPSDSQLLSDEAVEILSNPKDVKIYKKGLEELDKTQTDVTITLSSGKKITLVN